MKRAWAPRQPAPRRRSLLARHPYVFAALALHVLLLAALYRMGPYSLKLDTLARNGARIDASLEQARRTQMRHYVQRLEDLQRRLDAATGTRSPEAAAPGASGAPADRAELLKRAQALVERMEKTEQGERAKALARLLKITPEQALAKVKAEDRARHAADAAHAASSADPAVAAARLEQRARQALDRQLQRQAREQQGSQVALAGEHGQGGGSPGGSQGASQGGAGSALRGAAGGAGSGTGQGDSRLAGGPVDAEAGFSDVRNYTKATDIDVLDARSVIGGTGRVLGPGGALANRLYLDRWYVAGPFATRGPASLDDAYPPEWGVDLDAVYEGKDKRLLQWQYYESPTYPYVPPDRAENAVYYAWTELRVDRDTTVWLDIGADDDSKLWVNDQLVWISGAEDKPWYHRPFTELAPQLAALDLVEGRRRVTLHAGSNTLLFKLYNGRDLMFFSVAVMP